MQTGQKENTDSADSSRDSPGIRVRLPSHRRSQVASRQAIRARRSTNQEVRHKVADPDWKRHLAEMQSPTVYLHARPRSWPPADHRQSEKSASYGSPPAA